MSGCGTQGLAARPCCEGCAAAGTACGGACSGTKKIRYAVQAGDTPASIAAKLTGSPSRMRELLVANPDKPQAGGTFTDLYIGEALTIPSNWGLLQGLGRRLVGAGARTKQTAFGLGQSPGPNAVDATTLDTDVQAIVQEGVNGTLCQDQNQSVLQFQIDYDDIAFTGNDGRYGPNTAAAAQQIISGAPAACAAWSGAPIVSAWPAGQPSAQLVSLAQQLDSLLASTPANTCENGDTASAVAVATYNFKMTALAQAGCSGAACATVAPGITVNTTGAAAYAYGPGTDALLGAVLIAAGDARTYTGGPWTDTNGVCLATGGTPVAAGSGGGGGVIIPNPHAGSAGGAGSAAGGAAAGGAAAGTATASSSSSTGLILGGLALAAAAAGGLYYMHKHPAHVTRAVKRAKSTVRGALARRRTATA